MLEHLSEKELIDSYNKTVFNVVAIEKVEYAVLEVEPSAMTNNVNVKWLMAEFSRLYQPLINRINIANFKVTITPELNVWWEVFLYKGKIKFYLVVPNKDNIKDMIKRQVMKTWKRSNVREITDYIPHVNPDNADFTRLRLKHNSLLSLNTKNSTYTPLDSFLNAKHYLKDEDMAVLQIGMSPVGNDWNNTAKELYDSIRKNKSNIPRKKGKAITKVEVFTKIARGVGLIAEEIVNFIADFLIPGWEEDTTMKDSASNLNGELGDTTITRDKARSEAFKTDIRVLSQSIDSERRKSIIRAIASGFDPLEGDNRLEEVSITNPKKKSKEIANILNRKMPRSASGNIMCSLELAKMIQVPDQKAQIEHYNELNLVQHRGEADVPKEIFVEDEGAIPFAKYEDTDGTVKPVYFSGKDKNLLCMPRVFIGEPGTGKTTIAQNIGLSSFNKGYGVFLIDAADGKMAQRILDRVRPDQRNKVKIIDFTNTENPIGLGWNEIYRSGNIDIIEDAVVEEIIQYIELVAGVDLNMRAKLWVENAVKATFTTPEATLLDVENMLNNAEFRNHIIPTIEDPELRADWEYYHEKMKPEERKVIYDEAFRRLAPVMRKKTLKNFILQKPKKDESGDYLVDIRKWMDEGYLVIVKANESLTEPIQTALVAFLLAKFNLAMISREDIVNEDDRHPCFLLLDEPDHYIRGSERWRNMLTRFRKYRCGLNFMFHGWQQLVEADRNLPKIIRKSGPHYIIFQTDEDNLLELKSVIEPEFKISQVAKGMPQRHAIIKLKMYSKDGNVVPAFMAESIGRTEDLFEKYNNDDLYEKCAKELGRPKHEVMNDIFKYRNGSEFGLENLMEEVEQIPKNLQTPKEVDEVSDKRKTRRKMEHEVGTFLEKQAELGFEPDMDLVEHIDEILGGDMYE